MTTKDLDIAEGKKPAIRAQTPNKLINLTGKNVSILNNDKWTHLAPDGHVKFETKRTDHGKIKGIQITHIAYTFTNGGLPDEERNTYLIVAPEIRRSLPGRLDLLSCGQIVTETKEYIDCRELESN